MSDAYNIPRKRPQQQQEQQQQEQSEACTEHPPPPKPTTTSSTTTFDVLDACPVSENDGSVVRDHHQDDHDRDHKRTWSADSFTEIASDLFGKAAAYVSSPAKPPPAPRLKSISLEEEQFHGRNRKFLVQAEKEKSRMVPPPAAPFARLSPSVSSKGRKRLESIEENTGTAYPVANQKKQHVRNQSDEVSALSNGSWYSSSSHLSKNQLERITNFERELQNQFDRKKKDIVNKLSHALDQQIPSENDRELFIKEYMEELELERESLIAVWKAELEAEREALEPPPLSHILHKALLEPCLESITSFLATAEVFIANLPLTIGAVGLSWVTMGTVWFKYMEENSDFCVPVHFYSSKCSFPEYPGCFECDTSQDLYTFTLYFHLFCSAFAGLCCVLFFLKFIIASEVVSDELSNPTTSTPMGVVCIATICVFAGQGTIGGAIVIVTSIVHFILAFWFLYMSIYKFGLWPDPGWFPNTVGISYAAIKTWLYYPTPGLILLSFCVVFFFAIFFISVVRVALNKKIAAPVAWIGLSAPSITLYGLSLVAQPTLYKQELLDRDSVFQLHNHEWMVSYYLPFQHFMMFLSLVGLASAVHALVTRWETFRKKPFSPAHVAFCFPTLSHTNAIQCYRGAIDSFSSFPPGSPFKVALYVYWCAFLVGGTILNLVFTYMYFRRLPQWTKLDTAGEDEPPHPDDTFVHEMLDGTGVHEIVFQRFTSPAVLQANEAGALVRVRRGTEDYRIHGPYVRTRKVTALGFDPTMDDEELRRERAELLDWVAKNAPRTRNRTMSNPLILQNLGQDGQATDIDLAYGTFAANRRSGRHKRSVTSQGIPGV